MKDQVLFIFAILLFQNANIAQSNIFWADRALGAILTSDNTGANVDTLVLGQTALRRLRFDNDNTNLYWTGGDGVLKRSDLNGQNVTSVLSVSTELNIVELSGSGRIYFTETGDDMIKVCELDGSNLDTFVLGAGTVQGLDVDETTGHVFWTDFTGGAIYMTDSLANNVTTIYDNGESLFDLQLDFSKEHIYFANRSSNTINRINYDGSDFQTIVSTTGQPGALSLNLSLEELYFISNNQVFKINLDGTSLEMLHSYNGAILAGICNPDTGIGVPTVVENVEVDDYRIFPNPSFEALSISSKLPMHTISVLDLQGRVVLRRSNCGLTEEIDTSIWESGTYFLNIQNDSGEVLSRKIIKM